MIDSIEPSVRLELVNVRIAALTRGADAAIDLIRAASSKTQPRSIESMALGLVESEINYLDGRTPAAFESFAKNVEPLLPETDPNIAVVLADNRYSLFWEDTNSSSGDDFYHLVDQRRLLGVQLWNYEAIHEAFTHASKNQHYRALPLYWQQLQAAYNLQSWRAIALAERDFAYELIRLNQLCDAAYHSVMSRDKDAVDAVTNALLWVRSPDPIRATLAKLLSTSCLKQHASFAAMILGQIADLIPDDALVNAIKWLQKWAPFVPTTRRDVILMEKTWEAVESISIRLDKNTAASFATTAMAHSSMNGGAGRQQLIRALKALCPNLETQQLEAIGNLAVELIREKKNDFDYSDSIRLLCQAADAGGDEIKKALKAKVFPPGSEIKDTLLIQAGYHLGAISNDPVQVSENARKISREIRKQVQQLSPGEQPAKIGGFGTINNGNKVVHISGGLHWVDALIPPRHYIDSASVGELLSAILAMITDDDNIIENRASLATSLLDFVDCIPDDMVGQIIAQLEPLAEGHIVESKIGQSHSTATHPLNPFRMGTGDPIKLRGAALRCLANICRLKPEADIHQRKNILVSAITSENAELRLYGLVSATEIGELNPVEQNLIALAGLDSDQSVARIALDTMRITLQQRKTRTLPGTWHTLLRSIENAVQYGPPEHRCAAARLLREIPTKKLPRELRERFRMMSVSLRNDVCYSVRASCSE